MIHPFDPNEQLIVLRTRIVGPAGELTVRLALDTGASSTVIGWESLAFVGYGLGDAVGEVQMTTGSATEHVPKIMLKLLDALGKRRKRFEVVAHTLPIGASVDGLLGLDYFRKTTLKIDFRKYNVRLD